MPTAAYDPGLLREQQTPLVIGKNWFLDQETPAGGFVRIQDSSQVWEERVDETRIITMEGLTTCLDPGRGWTSTSGGWNFLKKQECWEGHEQALITTIRKETKQTEQLEEAGYRSPTWAVLRALQQINSATRIEGEAAMSAHPFFQSAGRGDKLFWGRKKRTNRSNMGESIRTRTGKLAGRVEHHARLGRVVQVQKRGGGNALI